LETQLTAETCAQISVSFAQRKGNILSSPSWLAAISARATTPATKLTRLALQICNILERSDAFCASNKPIEDADIADLLTEIGTLEESLSNWLLQFYQGSSDDSLPYHRTSITTFPTFVDRCGGLRYTFPTVFMFPSFLSATMHVYIWICQLLLREATASVAHKHPDPLLGIRNQASALAARIEQCATNLCQAVPYLASKDYGTAGVLACGGPLHFAGLWYTRMKNVQKSLWCGFVRDFLQRGILTGGSFETSINLSKPIFSWWVSRIVVSHMTMGPQ
jgi:hypothetical protein